MQKLYGRSILNSFHAVWSIGAVAGGSLGALTAELELPSEMAVMADDAARTHAQAIIERQLAGSPSIRSTAVAHGPTWMLTVGGASTFSRI